MLAFLAAVALHGPLQAPPQGPPLRYIDPKRLPKPYATEDVRNDAQIVARGGAPLHAAPGFRVDALATGLDRPRRISVAPNGDVFVAESYAGRVAVLRGGKRTTFATGLKQPYGIAFYPPGPAPRFVYIAHTDRVVRYPYRSGELKLRGEGETLLRLPGGGYNQHWTRNVLFSPKGDRMFVTVGSASNASPEPAPRASILVAAPDGKDARTYASGLRNPVGLAFQPGTGRLWAAVNERDRLGDDLVPDYTTHVEEDGFYGWPYFYIGGNPDPRVAIPANVRLKAPLVPDVLLEAHCAALGVAFPPAGSRFKGAFVSMHGSWNRARRSGYKVVRAILDANGNATGRYQDFVWGFATPQGRVWGRPVDVAFAKDGALLFSDDASGTIWRVRPV